MLKNPLVQDLLNKIVQDEETMHIIHSLEKGINTDEGIAEKTEIKLNIVRKVLYKLYNEGLASYKRDKDPETQWYTYTWEFDVQNVVDQVKEQSTTVLDELKQNLEHEENNMFFECPDGHVRYNFDIASDKGFICPECSNEIQFQENNTKIDEIKEEISSHEEIYASIREHNAK